MSRLIASFFFGLFLAVYQLLLTVLIPLFWWRGRDAQPGNPERERLEQRFLGKGLFGWKRRTAEKKQGILIHAVSLGEAKVAWELVKRLDRDRYNLVVTVTTLSSYEYLLGLLKEEGVVRYLPFDWFPFIYRLLRTFNVCKVYVIEHDLWPGLLVCGRLLNIPVILINGHFSKASLKTYKKTAYISTIMLNMLTELHLQHEHEHEELAAMGVNEEKMSVTGSLKLLTASNTLLSHPADQFQVCFGSCHDVEFSYLAGVAAEICKMRASSRILFVPRHPDNAGLLIRALEAYGIKPLFTQLVDEAINSSNDVVVLAEFGTLLKAYMHSLIGVVCGSFDPSLKGHNLLEPIQCGAVSLHGPYIEAQKDIAEFMQKNDMEGRDYIDDSLLDRIFYYIDTPSDRDEIVGRYKVAISSRQKEMENYFFSLRSS